MVVGSGSSLVVLQCGPIIVAGGTKGVELAVVEKRTVDIGKREE